MNLRAFVAIGLLIVLFAAGGYYAMRASQATNVYRWQIEVGQLPPDDTELEQWLRQQPGVLEASVTRNDSGLVVEYRTNSMARVIQLPRQLDEMGYGERGAFQQSLRTEW